MINKSMPRKFRKKPIIIEAIQYTDHPAPILAWLGSSKCQLDDDGLVIQTLEGVHEVTLGDWIIKGIKGEFYPCKPDIFEATYEQVDVR